MDPLWALVAELWWVGPAAAGAGTLGWVGVLSLRERRSRRSSLAAGRPRLMSKGAARRLELDAAILDLQASRDAVARTRAEVQVAQAELMRLQADRMGSRAHPGAVEAAKARVHAAQRDAKTALANVRARQAGVHAARVTLPAVRAGRAPLPLERLMAQHDAVTERWMAYETDPELSIAYPSMTDARSPLLAAFLREQSQAQWLRPATSATRISPVDFIAYRDAVRRAGHALDDAEHDARRRAGEAPSRPVDPASDVWNQVARGLADNAQQAVSESVRAVGRAARDRLDRARAARQERGEPGSPGSAPSDPPPRGSGPVWPVPGRDRRPPKP